MMEVILKANTENTLSADETRALAAHIQALQQRLERAEAEVVALTTAVNDANQRAQEAQAASVRIRAAVGWAIAELTGVLTGKTENHEKDASAGAGEDEQEGNP